MSLIERRLPDPRGIPVGWAWFCAWMVVGAVATLGAVSLGPLALGPATIAGIAMFSRERIRRSALGLLSGTGVLLLFVAWVQRHGPGTTCWHTATAGGCDQHLNPIPWLVGGLVSLVAGVLEYRRRRDRR